MSDALYDGPNRVIIDDNTPETNTLPVSGGKGVDEFLITLTANSVVIDDESEANVIVFERDVVITSIERKAGSEGASVAQYVITLSSGKTITLRNPASFTFQHFGDDTRTAAISAEDFFTAHEDGFQPLDAPLSDIIGTASGPSGAQEPLMITGVFSREVTEGTTEAIVGILNNNMGATVSVVLRDDEDTDGALKGEYGTITFAPSAVGGAWTYTLDNTNTEVNALGEGDRLSDNFIFTISGVSGSDLTVTIVIIGVNDDPESGTAIVNAGGLPIIQRSSLTYNPDETSITIDETMLKVTSGNASDPTLLVYTITTLPDAGMLLKSGTQLNNGDTFTQADINNGLIVYQPSVSSLSTSQSNPLSFTLSDGEADGLMETLQITSRKVVGNAASAQDNTVDFSEVDVPQKIEAGDGSDIITGGAGDDQIDGGAGDDEITLTRTVNNVEEDAGADEVLYTFGYDGVGIDGGDEIVGFKRGQDKVTFIVQDSRQFANLEEFLGSLKGVDDADLTADDTFIVTMQWGTDEAGAFYFDGVLLHFKDVSAFGGGRVSSPVVQITFDERLDFDGLVEILGGTDKVAANFDFTHAAFKNLDEVLPRLFGEGSIGFKVIPFSVLVIDGPVTGAEVFFDIDDNGEVSDAEKDAQRDESGRSLYITGDDGSVSIPKKYVGLAFVAVVGSAYDTDSGERLEGEFRSLDKGRGGIATPITDLIVTYLEEVEGEPNAPTTEQGVLNKIFGDDVIMVSDVLVMENYELPESGAVNEVKKQMIATAAIALTKIKENDDLADGDADRSATKVEIASTVNTLVATPEASSVTALKEAVDERVEEVNEVKGGKPIATPTSVDGVEDTDYAFPDTPEALTGLFGFLDPSGNSSSADASAFRGVYIKIDIENASLRLDDNTQIVASTDLSGRDSAPTIDGYVYVTFGRLDELKLSPVADFNGALKLVYRVWDGEETSSDAELIINIAGVNDVPEVGTSIEQQRVMVDLQVTPIDLSDLFTDVDGDELTLTVTGLPSGLSYAPDTGITGTPDTEGTFTVTVVATDGNGGTVESTFEIVVSAQAISGDETGSVTEGSAPGDDNTGTLTAPGNTITLVSKETTDSPGTSTGTYGVMRFNASSGEWVYTLDDRAEALADQQTETESFIFSAGGATFEVTITITGANDAPTVSGEFFTRERPTGERFTLSNLSDRFTDVDEGDELTFTVTLDDGAALSTIGLTYDSDEDEITGSVTEVGTYVIKIVATDKSGATVEATFDLYILGDIPIIQRNSLTYNPDATSITIDETMLKVASGNESDPALLVYTITTLPDAGMLLKSGTPLNNGDTFIQADINNGLITYVPSVSSPYTSQSNPLSFTISDGVVDLEEQTLEITSREVVGNTAYEGDPSTSGDLDVNDDTLLASTTPFTISTQGTYGTASIGDDGEWVYKLDNGHADVRALNSGDTLTDTFLVDVNLASGRAKTQTVTITISGRTDVLGTNGPDSGLGDASTSDNQAIFGFNYGDTLTGGSGDDLLVGGYGRDTIDLSAGGIDTVVYRINSRAPRASRVKAEDGGDTIIEFTPGEDKLVILDVNESPTTLAALFDSLIIFDFRLGIEGDEDRSGYLSSSELDAGARYSIQISFQASGRDDEDPASATAGGTLTIFFDRVTSKALNDRAVWDTLTGGSLRSTIPTVAQLSSLFGGFGRPGYDAALDDGGFISVIGPDDLPDSYFEEEQTLEITSREVVGNTVYEGDPSTSGDLDVNDDTLLASTTPFTISTQGTYGTASIGDDGEWVYKLDNGHADVRALNSGDTLTDTFVVDVNLASGRATTQTVTITISGRTDVLGTNGPDSSLGDASTSDNQAIFGFNYGDTLTGGSGDDLLVGGYGRDTIDLSAGGIDTVVYRINSRAPRASRVKAEDGGDTIIEFTPGEDKLVILDVNESPTTLAALFDSLIIFDFRLGIEGDEDRSGYLSSSELDAGARYSIQISFQASGRDDEDPASATAGGTLTIFFDRVTSKALNDRAVWDTLTGGSLRSTIPTVAQLSSLFGGFGRPGYDAALDDGGFISVIGPDDLPDSYFEEEQTLEITSREVVGNTVYEGDPSTSSDLDVNDDTLLASTTPFTISTQGTYGTASIGDDGEWVYKLDNGHADVRALNSGDTLTDTFVVDVNLASGRATTQTVTITISGRTDVLGTNGPDSSLGDASTSDNQAIFGFNYGDTLTGGSGDDLLVGGYGRDTIDLSAGGIDTVVYRINSRAPRASRVKAEDGGDTIIEFTPGEDKLVILDVNESPTTLAGFYDSLIKFRFQLRRHGDDDRSGYLSSSELDAGARYAIQISFEASGRDDEDPASATAGGTLTIFFDRVTSKALNDRAVWDTLTGGTNFLKNTIPTVAHLSSLFGGFGRPGYDAALDDGGFISVIGPDDLPDSYFEIA